ncbi:hypothetical protein PY254_10525 [Rhodanobacter sp. AS-Z3]|uniref:hypothetical protein n=1 Tax=Rhodanobacter sp. AS-Z3 TaxID=3031330 RepID=UPI002479D0CE|nr:hypothetical protein [Rhodanobacter sp. AS-Z3]WEN13681.1 hypothetical protein PY254_10525 [Rhodanobacter sp. AS-Z3]
MKWTLLAPLMLALLGGCQPNDATTGTSAVAGPVIKADQEVQLARSSYGCIYPIVLSAAIDHYNRHEFTAWASTVNGPGCFYDLPPDLRWTVLQVRDGAAQIGFHTTSQYEAGKDAAPNIGQDDYWVPLEFMMPAPEQP